MLEHITLFCLHVQATSALIGLESGDGNGQRRRRRGNVSGTNWWRNYTQYVAGSILWLAPTSTCSSSIIRNSNIVICEPRFDRSAEPIRRMSRTQAASPKSLADVPCLCGSVQDNNREHLVIWGCHHGPDCGNESSLCMEIFYRTHFWISWLSYSNKFSSCRNILPSFPPEKGKREVVLAFENDGWQWLTMEAAGTMLEGMMNFIYRSSSVVHTSQRLDAHVTV